MKKIKTIHPFPARMAPELALAHAEALPARSIVLDPMAGSGTVLRQALAAGHNAIGFDMDPLAVLMARVWNTPLELGRVEDFTREILAEAETVSLGDIHLPWIDDDAETGNYISYWFAKAQIDGLRRLTHVISQKLKDSDSLRNFFHIALSRIIVTKESGASLAKDASHSRPHRVAIENDYDVFKGFARSSAQLRKILSEAPPPAGATVSRGDARKMTSLEDASVDAIITSPPYLNAIDYLRGHKLSLVWMGYTAAAVREIRSGSVGAERGIELECNNVDQIVASLGPIDPLPQAKKKMVRRYANDLYVLMGEIHRVLKPGGSAVFVVGNSCLRGVFIRNSAMVAEACQIAGLHLTKQDERELPAQSRYLPMPTQTDSALGKRMRTETIMKFERAA